MKIAGAVYIHSAATHECGEYLEYELNVSGESAEATISDASRFTLTSYFAADRLHWKAHGTRITKCVNCKKPLPGSVAEWRDEDFKS